MDKITVAPGIQITNLILGANASRNVEDAERFAFMDRYADYGGNCLDSARLYQDGERDRIIGRWLKSRGNRDKIMVVTKGCHPRMDRLYTSRLSQAEIVGDLEESLSFMQIDYSDMHILHRDDIHISVEQIMPTLDKLVKDGKTRAIGASNWTAARINEANQFAHANNLTPFTVSQMHFSLAQATPMSLGDITQVPMSDVEYGWYQETGMAIMGYGAMARGYFAKLASGDPIRPSVLRAYDYIPENRRRALRVKELASQLHVSVAAATIAYVCDCGLNSAALCGFPKIEQMQEAMQILTFRLSKEQIKWLEAGE